MHISWGYASSEEVSETIVYLKAKISYIFTQTKSIHGFHIVGLKRSIQEVIGGSLCLPSKPPTSIDL